MGAIFKESAQRLHSILRCDKKEFERHLREMSETVIAGSFEIWRKHVKRIHTGREEQRPEIEELIEHESHRTNEGTTEEAEGAEEATEERNEEIEGIEGIVEIEGIEIIEGIEVSEEGEFVEAAEADDEGELEADEEGMGHSGEREE
jgi:hypothetical protein